MTVIDLKLPDEQAANLMAQAEARGLTIEQWIAELTGQAGAAPENHAAADRPIWEKIADNMRDVPEEEFEKLPKDGASQVDHYLYGHPKR